MVGGCKRTQLGAKLELGYELLKEMVRIAPRQLALPNSITRPKPRRRRTTAESGFAP